jgi:hypothetical protein
MGTGTILSFVAMPLPPPWDHTVRVIRGAIEFAFYRLGTPRNAVRGGHLLEPSKRGCERKINASL